jgi:hypothetical protein
MFHCNLLPYFISETYVSVVQPHKSPPHDVVTEYRMLEST